MHAEYQAAQIGDHSGKGLAQRFTPCKQHIIMAGLEVTGACCRGGSQSTLHAIAFWRIADLLGDGKADASVVINCRNCLQSKCRPPGAIAPGSLEKLRAPLQAAQFH